MRKLLIADCNEDFRLALADALQDRYHVLCCSNGREALDTLRREAPELLVLDLMLPELDGITLLEAASAENIRPKVLAATPLLTDYVLDSAHRLGIGYLMRKPCDIHAVAARIRDLSHPLNPPVSKPDRRTLLLERLLSLSISPKHNGYAYLTEAILLLAEAPGQSVTKELYPAVARICGCGSSHVERSVRNALEVAWKHGDPAVWQRYFPDAVRRPSNAVFLSRMAAELGLETE